MISPERPTDIDAQPTGLDYWVNRCCGKSGDSEWHFKYKATTLTVHPNRAALLILGDKQVMVEHDPKRYKGRGWLENLVADIEAAVAILQNGGGKSIPKCKGDFIRAEIARRASTGQRPPEERETWLEWAEVDELPLLMGAWMLSEGVLRVRYEVSRNALLDFHPTNEEFDMSRLVCAQNMWTLLVRVIRSRMPPKDKEAQA